MFLLQDGGKLHNLHKHAPEVHLVLTNLHCDDDGENFDSLHFLPAKNCAKMESANTALLDSSLTKSTERRPTLM